VSFCGIAKPERFHESIRALGGHLVKTFTFPDHHWFTAQDLKRIQREAKKHKADFIITTEKDLVRISDPSSLDTPIATVDLAAVWLQNVPAVINALPDKKSGAGKSEIGVSRN
jgi:tetraacyldisaccharide 4'-kinase